MTWHRALLPTVIVAVWTGLGHGGASLAHAETGYVVTYQEETQIGPQGTPQSGDSTFYLTRGKWRQESSVSHNVTLYDAGQQTFWTLDTARHTARRLDAHAWDAASQRMAKGTQQMQTMMAQARERMAAMPPEQRAQMETTMRAMGISSGDFSQNLADMMTLHPTGERKTIAGYPCEGYTMGPTVSQMTFWYTHQPPPGADDPGFRALLREMETQMDQFIQKLPPAMRSMMAHMRENFSSEERGFLIQSEGSGMLPQQRALAAQQGRPPTAEPLYRSTFQSIRGQNDLAPSLFEVPPGYRIVEAANADANSTAGGHGEDASSENVQRALELPHR